MSIISFNVQAPMLQGVAPRTVQLVTTDSLSTITTAGYMNKQGQVLAGENLAPTDVMNVIYNYSTSTNSGTFGIFNPTFSGTVITLVEWTNPGDVLLPVISGDVAIFNGTTGQIKDSGAALSNTADPFLVSSPGSLTIGNFPALNDAHGTISAGLPPSAASQAYLVTSPGSLTSGHLIKLADANGTIADQGFQMKSVAQVAVTGGAAAQTVTDAFCTTGSMVTASWNDTTNAVEIKTVAAGNGSFVVTSTADPGASHLNYIITKV